MGIKNMGIKMLCPSNAVRQSGVNFELRESAIVRDSKRRDSKKRDSKKRDSKKRDSKNSKKRDSKRGVVAHRSLSAMVVKNALN